MANPTLAAKIEYPVLTGGKKAVILLFVSENIIIEAEKRIFYLGWMY